MSTLRKVLHEYRFHVWSSELRRPVMNANKTWRAKWFELVLKVTDPRFYSMAAADNQRIQKWSGMRWLMIDDTNIRNTLQCKFQLNIPLRSSFFFHTNVFWFKLYEHPSWNDCKALTAQFCDQDYHHTLYRGVGRQQTVLETFQVNYNVLPRLAAEVFLSFEMQCHFQKTAKRFSLTFCRISFKFFWWFSSILNFLFLIESYLKSNVLLPSHKDCQFLRVRFFRNWCNLSGILFVSWAVVDFCFFLG